MSNHILRIEDLILFVLNNSNPNMGIKKLNKLAFLIEFSYIFEHQKALTDCQYAAIDMGPVVDDYKTLITRLIKEEKIRENEKADPGMNDYLPIEKYQTNDVDLESFLKLILDKYDKLNATQLERLTHDLDSYNITVHENGGAMGGIIDKDLAMLDYSLSSEEL